MSFQTWPNGARGAVSVTMDNMGEAADLHRNLWPADKAIGSHYSVTTSLPRMLDILESHRITATYFIEGWNSDTYPTTIQNVAEKGHEVGFHAWQHEVWRNLDQETEVKNLDRSLSKIRSVLSQGRTNEDGSGYKGFRPPGGLVTEQTLGLMKQRGFTYLSPAAERCAIAGGIAMVPFRWHEIDAYFYLPSMASIRKKNGDPEDTLSAEVLKQRLISRIDEVSQDGGYLSLLFHPFLTTGADRVKAMEDVLDHLKSKDQAIWIAPCHKVAEWILEHPQSFSNDPGWDRAEWKTK